MDDDEDSRSYTTWGEGYIVVLAVSAPTQIVKRDGKIVPFNRRKITDALDKAFLSVRGPHKSGDAEQITELTDRVINVVGHKYATPTVEQVQDVVEFVLQSAGQYAVAKHYILYRAERTKEREQRTKSIPEEIRRAYEEDNRFFKTPLQRFQFLDKYARWDQDKGRRETWVETVTRTVKFLRELANGQAKRDLKLLTEKDWWSINNAILEMRIMPSMRLMAMAGEPARRDNAVIYNCSYLAIDSIHSFCEVMSNSMAGCGVGFSVEFEHIDKLPKIEHQKPLVDNTFVIFDSAEGWVDALRTGLLCWFNGYDVVFDYSLIRPKGSPLKTKGGQASGHEPLQELLTYIRNKILAKQGKKLSSLDVHDVVCAIGNAVVSGGVRRTALISLFDEDDEDMLHCKDGDLSTEKQRWNANNSAVWKDMDSITQEEFVRRMQITFASKRGEPGIFSREVAWDTMPARRQDQNNQNEMWGTNPCGEIVLRSMQFCNLTDVIIRETDTLETISEAVRLAAIVGTIQASATYFPNLRPAWERNCRKEALLGIGLSGQLSNLDLVDNDYNLSQLRAIAIDTNDEYSRILGINQATAVTCVKPSGNSSVLVGSSSGLHAWWAPYYIRNVRVMASSPLVDVLREAGVPMAPENGNDVNHPTTYVVGFPVKAPDGAITRNNWSAIQQCELWLNNKLFWTEHNPSVTITYKPNEVLDLLNWLWSNKHNIGGMSFLPFSDAKYDQLPYVEITEEEYNKKMEEMPKEIDWSMLFYYEKVDHTQASQQPACETDVCELPVPN